MARVPARIYKQLRTTKGNPITTYIVTGSCPQETGVYNSLLGLYLYKGDIVCRVVQRGHQIIKVHTGVLPDKIKVSVKMTQEVIDSMGWLKPDGK